MRRGSWLVAGCLAGAVLALCISCTDDGGSVGPTSPGGDAGAPTDGAATGDAADGATTTDGAPPADGGVDAASLLLPCSKVAFCDDFEGTAPLPRGWRTDAVTNGARLSIEAGAGAGASAGLAAFAPGVSGAPGADQEAILLFDADGGGGATWGTRIAFAAKVVGDGSLAGPRLLTYQNNGSDNREVIVRFDASPAKTSARLDYLIIPCAECADPPTTTVDVGRDWHHYVLDVAATPGGTKATGHGRVKLFVDGKVAIDAPLGIPLSNMPKRTLDFGITSALDAAKGTIFLDDAYWELR